MACQELKSMARTLFHPCMFSLKANLLSSMGSSAYNEHVQATLSDLIEKGLVRDVENIGQMMQIGETQLPLVDKDGGYRQTATHLTYIRKRLVDEEIGWLIFVVDSHQKASFDKYVEAAKAAKWLPADDGKPIPKMSFLGLVADPSSVVISSLISGVMISFEEVLLQRGYQKGLELGTLAEQLALGGIKYAVLKNIGRGKSNNCKINKDVLLSSNGNNAFRLQLFYSAICRFIESAAIYIQAVNRSKVVQLLPQEASDLAVHLQSFPAVVKQVCMELSPAILCDFLLKVAVLYEEFSSVSHGFESRLIYTEATRVVMAQCFHFLGITPLKYLR
ncbi:arginine--tRNA ligase, chloroplastic/mitochondrial-like isoform X2 [Papaver somniferum]|uniref:arginine--tRNA ligase, chloroplastic/mitochondrial-like isoform X2 n=1 Tax=Papaver somniferum TaxID=3469 RepID=UPI000E6F6AAD|nr:arginine--tRNA ligase, chloroplastic/mitochondrial-like isoform X2 [Papaver somniferum]